MSSAVSEKPTRNISGIVRKFIVPIVCLAAVLLTWMITSSSKSDHASQLSSNQDQIAQLKNQVDIKNLAAQNKTVTLNSEMSGADDAQKSADDAAFKKLMSQATTWSTFSEYMDARKNIMSSYGLTEKDAFMKSFMPKISTISDRNGTVYNMIDTNGYNLHFDGMTSTLTNARPNDYSYFALVSTSSKALKTNDRSETRDVVTYTMDAKHHIKNIKVDKVTSQIYSSGSMG